MSQPYQRNLTLSTNKGINEIGQVKSLRCFLGSIVTESLQSLKEVCIEIDGFDIHIKHNKVHVPDWTLKWAGDKRSNGYYRVYIKVAHRDDQEIGTESIKVSHSIATIKTALSAVEFVNTLMFYYNNKANVKSKKT